MKQRIIAVLVALTAIGVFGGCQPTPVFEKFDAPGIANFTRFEGPAGFAGSSVAFGGATEDSAMPWLKSEGFGAVVNLRLASEEGVDIDGSRIAAEAAGLNYIHMPFNPANLDETFVANFLATAGDQANQPVYIHCGSATRVAALWMIERVLNDDLDIAAASEEVAAIAAKPEQAVTVATRYIETQGN